ncbi:MAG: alpha/beta hydrolase [Alphaproteobacteria bacterium]|nr:MAG: alpha/beta hydrolase [Alphaproteobacteria bacterium]
MIRRILAAAAFGALALVVPSAAPAQIEPSLEDANAPRPLAWGDFGFGAEKRDRVEYAVEGRGKGFAVLLFVDGPDALDRERRLDLGFLPGFALDHGLLPMRIAMPRREGRTAAEQLAKLADAVAAIGANGRKYGYDGSRIVLAGEGWGAGMAAALGTDPVWLERAGVPFGTIRGVLALDPRGLDLAADVRQAEARGRAQLARVIGPAGDPLLYSAAAHAAAPNAPHFLFETVGGSAPAAALAEALRSAGGAAEVASTDRTQTRMWSSYPGHATHKENARIAAFLAAAVR